MTRSFAIALAAAFTVGLGTLALAQGGLNQERPAGVYVHQVAIGPGLNVPAVVALNSDNTVAGASSLMFAGMSGNEKGTPIHGVWRMTGPRTIGATTIFFTFDGYGMLTGYQRNRCTLQFSADFMSYEGKEFIETTTCGSPLTCPDPLHPATEWTPASIMPVDGFSVSGKRLEWLASGTLD